MNTNNNNNKGATITGVTFTELLQLAFIILKLVKVINWSWFWVLAPTWISITAIIIVFIILLVIYAVINNWPQVKIEEEKLY